MASSKNIPPPIKLADDHSDTSSSSASATPAAFRPRRSWLSTITTSSAASHRSSFSSSAASDAPSNSPKPHKAHQAAWEAMRRLTLDSGGRVGLEHFRLVRRVGSGDIGSVYLCQIRNPAVGGTHGLYAMKVVDREALASRKKLNRAETEKDILSMLDHPFLPTLYTHFHASHYSCLVMEFCPGGDLYSARFKLASRRFPLPSAKFYAAETLLALEYLHMMGIVYRDLKPENVLVRDDGHIMLSDFDLSFKCDVVPKLLKQNLAFPRPFEDHFGNNSSPRRNHHVETTCASGPLRPVLTSCFSLRRRLTHPLTTTITEHVDNAAVASTAATGHHNEEDEEEEDICSHSCGYRCNYNNNNSSNSTRRTFMDRTDMVAEPIEARSRSFVGTHEYLAPEVISGQGHGSAVDWWTFGVFLYEMIFGMTPFKGQNNEETLKNILKQPLRFPAANAAGLTAKEEEEMEAAKDLIRKLLVKNPKKRFGSVNGSVEIKRHGFFSGVNWALIRSVRPPVVPAEEARKRMMRKGGGRSAAAAVLAVPKVLSKKERDQPYQIPAHHNHDHHFDYF